MLLNDVMIKQLMEKDPTFIQPFEGRKMKFGARMWWQLLLTRRENKRNKDQRNTNISCGGSSGFVAEKNNPCGDTTYRGC